LTFDYKDRIVKSKLDVIQGENVSNPYLKEFNSPFKHWILDEFLTEDCLKELKAIEHQGIQTNPGKRVDSDRLFVHRVPPEAMPNLWQLQNELAEGAYRLMFENITGQNFEGTFPRIEIISDFGDFELKPHHDHLEKKLSAMVYTNHEQLFPGTVLGDDHVVETKDNRCMFFVPADNTWHHYPKTHFTKIRRALMINYWTYQV
jgi:hypothetical protein